MTKARIWFLAVTAALGGFLFGFDTIVINGAEQDIQALWNLSGTVHGWVVSSALWGTVLGSLCGGGVSDRWGRRRTLFAVGVLFFVSAVWSACATGPWTLIAARFIGGLGVGVSTIAAPVYIAEIAPAASRGRMTALFQFNIVFGVLASLASNLALKGVGPNAWRWMLGVEAVPAFVFTALCPFLVESPRWLAQRGAGVDGDGQECEARFWSRANLRPILLAFFVAFFNQLSGCNAVNYFAPRIFNLAGFARDAQFLATFGLGILNFAATFTGVWLIDRLGRRTLLLVGGAGYLVSLFAASIFFYLGNGVLSAAMVFLFLAAHFIRRKRQRLHTEAQGIHHREHAAYKRLFQNGVFFAQRRRGNLLRCNISGFVTKSRYVFLRANHQNALKQGLPADRCYAFCHSFSFCL